MKGGGATEETSKTSTVSVPSDSGAPKDKCRAHRMLKGEKTCGLKKTMNFAGDRATEAFLSGFYPTLHRQFEVSVIIPVFGAARIGLLVGLPTA